MDELIHKLHHRHLTHAGMSIPPAKWTYDITKSYDWNYEYGPFNIPQYPKRNTVPSKKFLSFKLNSLFGVPAGPLLNSRWIETYSKLGFDILTYKTVRTKSYPAHPMPHVLYVEKDRLKNSTSFIGKPYFSKSGNLTITNSFGVPSKDPDLWQDDVKKSLRVLDKGQLLILSIMGTQDGLKTQAEFISDFAKCAVLAMETGVSVIEVNLSCPNLHSGGIVCYDVDLCGKICEAIKNVIGDIPLIVKIGYFDKEVELIKFLKKIQPYIDGISATNTLQGKVNDQQYKKIHMRHIGVSGVCGNYLKSYSLNMVKTLHKLRHELKMKFAIIGIGGVIRPEDYENYITVGADAVQSATGAMMNPLLAHEIYRKEISQKTDYQTAKSLSDSFFFLASKNLNTDHFKKLYLQMIFPKMLPENTQTLLVSERPFKLKHGEKGRKTSSIYLNHRNPIFSNHWDRKLLVQVLDSLIEEKILLPFNFKKKHYGTIAIPSSSSPELTALMLDLLPYVDRSVVLAQHYLDKEKGSHRKLYGEIGDQEPWIMIDDVFTSGKTMTSALKLFSNQRKNNSKQKIFAATFVLRNPEMGERFTKKTGVELFPLVTLDEIIQFHWSNFSTREKKIITKERKNLS